jgi:hypothetical protein
MIVNRLMSSMFRQPMNLAFMFSTKKKQMELTIRTPYRTNNFYKRDYSSRFHRIFEINYQNSIINFSNSEQNTSFSSYSPTRIY